MWAGTSCEYFTASIFGESWGSLWGLGDLRVVVPWAWFVFVGIGVGLLRLLLMWAHQGVLVVEVSTGVIVPVSSSMSGVLSLLGLFSYRELRVMLKESGLIVLLISIQCEPCNLWPISIQCEQCNQWPCQRTHLFNGTYGFRSSAPGPSILLCLSRLYLQGEKKNALWFFEHFCVHVFYLFMGMYGLSLFFLNMEPPALALAVLDFTMTGVFFYFLVRS